MSLDCQISLFYVEFNGNFASLYLIVPLCEEIMTASNENKAQYIKPIVKCLGNMSNVTRKTGPNADANRTMKSGGGMG